MEDPLPDTQTQTQTQTTQQWDVVESNCDVHAKVPWGQLLTKSITVTDKGQRFVVFGTQQSFNITEGEWSAGRTESLAFVFKSQHLPQNMLNRISKVHFTVSRDLTHPLRPVFIEDQSRNGTYVSGRHIGYGKKRILRTNDVISILNAEYKLFVFQDLKADLSHDLPKMITGKYYIGQELGSGACGVVRLVYDVATGNKFAMKQVVKMKLEDPGQKILNDPERIMNEVSIMKSLEHPCIVRMFEIYDRPESVFMVLELMRGGDMITRISKMPQRRLPESQAKFYFIQMCEAIKYLHDKGITHRDIKPDNILLATDEDLTLLKVTDFGLSKFVKKNSIMKTLCGTPQYVAPEILTTRGIGSYTKKVDVWSLGCCLYACLAGSLPFTGGENGDIHNIAHDIVRGMLRFDPLRWRNVSDRAVDIVRRCLTKEPQNRPAIDDVRCHRWLNDDPVIRQVERVMGRRVLECRTSQPPTAPPANLSVPEVPTNRVKANGAKSVFLLPEFRQRINNERGSTPPVNPHRPTAAKNLPVIMAREYDEEPPLKRTRVGP